MSASVDEQHWAQTQGVTIHHHLAPAEILGEEGHVRGVRFVRTDGASTGVPGAETLLPADAVLRAIGQKFDPAVLAASGVKLDAGRALADDAGRTGVPRLYLGGDCRAGGRDLTVEAVEDGKRAAAAIHADLQPA
jgi:glutamate synthase (NADPH/NADH) small chain